MQWRFEHASRDTCSLIDSWTCIDPSDSRRVDDGVTPQFARGQIVERDTRRVLQLHELLDWMIGRRLLLGALLRDRRLFVCIVTHDRLPSICIQSKDGRRPNQSVSEA